MKPVLRLVAVVVLGILLVRDCCLWARADDSDLTHQISLADLADYRVALSGKATADDAKANDPPSRVLFKDLWLHEDRFRGRRVTVQGRVSRIFRQGPVGSFPPLAEVWITSRAGDPICVVFSQPRAGEGDDQKRDHAPGKSGAATASATETDPGRDVPAAPTSVSISKETRDPGQDTRATPIPELGSIVHFTGTFLKLVRYASSDGARLAPLVVGDRARRLSRQLSRRTGGDPLPRARQRRPEAQAVAVRSAIC